MKHHQEDYEIVAEFTPDHRFGAVDPSIQEFDALLRRGGIEKYGLDGSRSYFVTVSKAQADLARELLKRARLKNGQVKVLERRS